MDEEQALEKGAVDWRHPPPYSEQGGGELDSCEVESSADESTPKLPDALFADDPDADTVFWYVHDDFRVLVMANRTIDEDGYREVARSRVVETDDGECKWEIPPELVVGRTGERGHGDVLGDARFEPGEAIHFRATEGMLAGETRMCFAMTGDQLARLSS